ncbi:hypothetical protein E6W39_02820 [Kitasatospora acidiphila]|uniref:Uncharacterized protein n=1 Tax=Kitasatospora acidiphila TaxID=2567942 RepID=A0A540VZ35_9ACTN|nr:hypothetical protein [Kitasatospora acidiphila]TQF01364.1 hypothetical protein E6W39_02820 [Kitasatospora acidiphila]
MTTGVPLTASPLMSAGLPEAPLPGLPAADVEQFVALSVALTGFDTFELRGTGMAARYLHAVVEEVGEQAYRDFRAALEEVGLDPERLQGEADQDLARAIAHLWYLGVWPPLAAAVHAELRRQGANTAFTVAPEAYVEGLVWRTFHGHPQGAKAPGFGTWATPPPGEPELPPPGGPVRRDGRQPGGGR